MPATETIPEIPSLTFHVDTGTLYLGDQQVMGLASVNTAWSAAHEVSYQLQDRINELENELRQLRKVFTADFARELIWRCEQFMNN